MLWQYIPSKSNLSFVESPANFVKQSDNLWETCTLLIEAIESLEQITKSGHDVERRDNRESNGNSSMNIELKLKNRLLVVKIKIDTFLFSVSFIS